MSKKSEKKTGRKKRILKTLQKAVMVFTVLCLLAAAMAFPFSKTARAFWLYPTMEAWFADAICHGAALCAVMDLEAESLAARELLLESDSWFTEILRYTSILSIWVDIEKLMKGSWDDQKTARDANTMINPATAGEMRQKVLTTIAQAQSVEDVQNELLTAHMTAVSNAPPPLPSEQFVCNLLIACQGPAFMRIFAGGVAKTILDGAILRYRSSTDDGAGPQAARQEFDQQAGKGAGGVKVLSKLDGAPEDIQAPTRSSMTSNADRDISAILFSRDAVLQMPKMKEETLSTPEGDIKVNVPDLRSDEENPKDRSEKENFLSAVQYCYKIAGFRPTPPSGDKMTTPEGRRAKAQWNYCAARQDAFLRQCAERIGRLTRPDCTAEDYKDICEASLHTCNAGRKVLVTSLPESFRNCAAGSNLYQAEYFCNMACESNRRYQAGGNLGSSHAQMLADIALCGVVRNSWEKQLEIEEKNFMRAVASMQNIDDCWKGAGAR